MSNQDNTVVEIKNISKSFLGRSINTNVLSDVSLTVHKGDFLVIIGPSGCGKSTLLHIVLGLETPNKGEVVFFNKSIYMDLDDDDRAEFRKTHIGMVYQQPNWIKSLTVLGNIMFALRLHGCLEKEAADKASSMLNLLGVGELADFSPMELSSGQQQKVALCRAIATNPDVLIADEPTGNLDYDSGQELMRLMQKLNKDGKTIIMVTHDLEYLTFANRAIQMFDGKIVNEISDPTGYIRGGIKTLKKGRI